MTTTMKNKGVPIEKVGGGGKALDIREGDILLAVNDHPVSDCIDYFFHKGESEMGRLSLTIERKGKRHGVILGKDGRPDIELRHFPIKRCRNNCIFCFVAQLPKGLRKTLYVKDEDYRMSFLYGNYITMTNLTGADKKRIAGQRLSPLYISVHSTNRAVRNKMLGVPSAPDIMKELRFLGEHKIRMHTQIVLCPGLNDNDKLKKTIADLCSLYPYVSSIAVVPVGLTAHRKIPLKPVAKEDAQRALDIIESCQRRFAKKHGDRIVYGADELYLRAVRAFPPLKDYGDLPQIENGVGMLPLFLSNAQKTKTPSPKGKFLTFTGVSFYPFLKKFLERLSRDGLTVTPVKVENAFFGDAVTVTGLLTGRDVMRALRAFLEKDPASYDSLLIPDCVLRDGKDIFLDDVSPADIEAYLGIKAKIIEPTPEGLARAIEKTRSHK